MKADRPYQKSVVINDSWVSLIRGHFDSDVMYLEIISGLRGRAEKNGDVEDDSINGNGATEMYAEGR